MASRTTGLTFAVSLLLLTLNLPARPQSETALSSLAASLENGQWAQLAANNMNPVFVNTKGATNNILPYNESSRWDPVTRQVFFMGSDHGGNPTPGPDSGYRFVSYAESTNTWNQLPNPPWVVVNPQAAPQIYTDAHGYDHTAIDPLGRTLYRKPYDSVTVRSYNIDSGVWTDLPTINGARACCEAIEFFPERDGLIWSRGDNTVLFYNVGTRQWSTLATNTGLATTWMFAEYNPVHKVVILGSTSGRLYKLGVTGGLTRLADFPSSRIYNGSGWTGVVTVDPVSGDYLVLTPGTRSLYVYNVVDDTWLLSPNSPPAAWGTSATGVVAAPISTYGVTMFSSCRESTSTCGVWLYKHAPGGTLPPTPPADTTLPAVSISSPAAGSTVTGAVSISAIASDNIGVAGVQFKVNGNNIGAEDTAPPYSTSWDTVAATAGTHILTAVARDAAGNQQTSAAVSVIKEAPPASPPPSPPQGGDFGTRCAASGVIKCVGFDQPSDIAGGYGSNSGILSGASTPSLDAAAAASGSSSLKFTVPSNSGADTSGSYFTNFSADLSLQFGAGEEFFYQWRQRFSPEFLNTIYEGGGGWKQSIAGSGDQPGQLYASCTALEVVTQNTYHRGYAQMYNSCTGSSSHGPYTPFEEAFQSNFKMQNARPAPYCLYSQTGANRFPPNGNCFGYFPNEWMTFQVGITLGPRVNDEFTNSYVRLWIAREGGSSELAMDWGPFNISAGNLATNQRFGKVWLLPYNTGKSAAQSHATAYTWYDELIISRSRIADPGGSSPAPDPGDTTPPGAFITAPTGGTVAGTVSVSASASDNVGVAGVQFTVDGNVLGAEDTTPPFGISWNTTSFANGSHQLRAIARDSAGNTASSAPVAVTVLNDAPPAVLLTAPAAGGTVSGSTVQVVATAVDDLGVAGVRFTLDGSPLGGEDTTAPFSVSWDTTAVPNGSHQLRAIAQDSGGQATTSAPISVTVFNDAAPTVFLTSPGGGTTVSGTAVVLSATAADDFGVAGVRFTLDGVPVGAEDTSAPFSLSWDSTAAPNGTYQLRAIARDSVGNITTSPGASITLRNDNAPIVAVTSPVGGSTVSGMAVLLAATVTDDFGIAGVRFTLNGSALGAEDTSAPFALSWDTTYTANGSHQVRAIARDSAGNNTISPPVSVTVRNDRAPAVSVTAPAAGATVSGPAVLLAALATDDFGVAGVQFTLDGNPVGAEDTSAPFSAPWDTTSTPNGSHQLRAIARDTAGNSTTSTPVQITLQNDNAPTVAVTAPAEGATVSGAIGITAAAADDLGIAGVRFTLDGNPLGGEDTAAPFQTSWNTTLAANGVHQLRAVARDSAGNTNTSAAVAVTVHNDAPPAVTLTSPPPGSTVSGKTISLVATAADDLGVTGVRFTLDGQPVGAEDTAAPYAITWDTTLTTNGLHRLQAIARDGSDNEAVSSEVVVTVFNDVTAPVVSITAPTNGAIVSRSGIMVTAEAGDDVRVAGVQFLLDGNPLDSEDTAEPYSIAWNTLPVSNGPHLLSAVARDADGNRTSSTEILVQVSNHGGLSSLTVADGGVQNWSFEDATVSVSSGSIEIVPDSYGIAPAGAAMLTHRVGLVLVTETGVPAVEESLAGSIYVDAMESRDTTLVMVNLNALNAQIGFIFRDADGETVGEGSYLLEGQSRIRTSLHSAPFNVPIPFQGIFTFTSSTPVAVVALRSSTNERGELLLSALPVLPAAAAPTEPQTLPHVVSGVGYTTEIVLRNPTPGVLTGVVQFYASDASAQTPPLALEIDGVVTSNFGYQIPPFGVLAKIVGSAHDFELRVGSARILPLAGGAPHVIEILSLRQRESLVSETAFAALPPEKASRMYVESSGEFGQSGSIRTGVAIANPSSTPIAVTLELMTVDGTISGVLTETIPGNGHVARFINLLWPNLPSEFHGVMRLSAQLPFSALSVRTRYNEREEFLFAVTPTSGSGDAPPPGKSLVLPLVASGGGYATDVFLYDRMQGGNNQGTLVSIFED